MIALLPYPALALAEVEIVPANADYVLKEAGMPMTAARWVIANEECACEEAIPLLTESEVALAAAETALAETQIVLT